MPFLEILRHGRIVRRQEIDLERSRTGVRVRLGKEVVQVSAHQSSIVDEWEAKIVPIPTASTAARPAAEPVPTPTLPGYELLDKIGEGGMGVVWKAIQLGTKRRVAIKFLGTRAFGSERAQKRFEREVELSAKLEHPSIARVYDSGLHRGVYYYAMELVHGLPLEQFVEQQKLSSRQSLALIRDICLAVQHAHERGVIHRDLKPGNILVSPDGRPHVLDFGLAKSLLTDEGEKQLTISTEGNISGTPAYMSPEQASGKLDQIDARSDVYSLGVMLYRLLVGKPPHDLSGSQYEVMRRIVEEEIRPPRELNGSLNSDLEAILYKALAQDPATRYASAAELAADIASYLQGDALTARRRTALYVLSKRLKRYRIPLAFAASLVAVVLVLGVVPGGWLRRLYSPATVVPISTTATPVAGEPAQAVSVVQPAEPVVAPAATQPGDSTPLADVAALQGQADAGWNSIAKIDGGQGFAARLEAANATRLTAQTLFDRNAYTDAKASLQNLLAAIEEIRKLDAARKQASDVRRKWTHLNGALPRFASGDKEVAAFQKAAGLLDIDATAKYEAADFLGAQKLWNRIFVELVPPQVGGGLEKARTAFNHKAYREASYDTDLVLLFDAGNADAKALHDEILKNDLDGSLTQKVANQRLPEVKFDHNAFGDVITFLQDVSGCNIVANWNSLAAVGVTSKTPVTLSLRDASLLQVVQAICDSLPVKSKIGFVCAKGVITISTIEDLKQFVTVVSLDVSDLLSMTGRISRDEQMKNLARCIEGVVAADTWRDNGGNVGDIKEVNGTLVVTQMPEVQGSISQFLEERFRKSYLFYDQLKSSPASSGRPDVMPATQPTNSPEFAEAVATSVPLSAALNRLEKVDRGQGFAAKLDGIHADTKAAYLLFDVGAYAAANDSFKKLLPTVNEVLALDGVRKKAIEARDAWTTIQAATAQNGLDKDPQFPWDNLRSLDTRAETKFDAGDFAGAQSLWDRIPAQLQIQFKNAMQKARVLYNRKDFVGAYEQVCWAMAINKRDASAKALRDEVVKSDSDGFLALSEKVLPELNMNGTGFGDAIDYLRKNSGANIFVNWRALEAAGIDRNAPITVALRNVTTAKALTLICATLSASAKVAFTCDAGVVTVSTAEDLSKNTKVVTYDISDLLANVRPPNSRNQQVDQVIRTIENTVAPDSWRDAGGTIGQARELNGRLVITQTAENHRAIAKLLAGLRDPASN